MNRVLSSHFVLISIMVVVALQFSIPQAVALTVPPLLIKLEFNVTNTQSNIFAFNPGNVGIPQRRQGGGTR